MEFAPVFQSILDELNGKLAASLTEEEADLLVTLLQKVVQNTDTV
jgi:hypothetical protein